MGSDGAFKIGARVRVAGWLECCYSLRGHELQGRFRWVKGGVRWLMALLKLAMMAEEGELDDSVLDSLKTHMEKKKN